MKLNRPASSSDLEVARETAFRLHQHRRQSDLPPAHAPAGPPAAAPPLAPPVVARPAAAALAPPPLPAREPLEPELPSWDETPAAPPASDLEVELPFSPEEMIETDESPAPLPFDEQQPGEPEVEPPMLEIEDVEPGTAPEIRPPSSEPSPFDGALDEPPEPAPDDLFGTPPQPSWDEVIETCFDLSMATGAMLIDPAGQVFAARGDWPDPGAEAIAAKLVAMLDRTLRDAPTRSVSAPVAGRHLTAWRVPLAEGLVTVAFVGDAPLRAELRPVIDDQILRGAGG